MPIFYGWIIVAVTFTAWGISIGPSQAYPIFLLSFIEEFGWSRALASGAFSVHMTFYALGGLALGILVDRIGARRVMAIGTAGWALSLLLCSQIRNVRHLYGIFGVLGGVATGGVAYVPNNAILARWFTTYRGLAAGISQSGVPLGGALFAPLAQLAITALGWRPTFAVFGLLEAAIALPLILYFLRDDPREMNLAPDGGPPEPSPAREPVAREPRGAAFTRSSMPPGYWILFGANVLRGMTMTGLLVHQVAYLVDVGYSKIAAASYFSMSSLLAVVGGFAAGAISDRVGRERTYLGIAALYITGVVSLLFLRHPSQVALVSVFILTSGLASGGVGPVFAALLTDRLHGPRFGFLVGLQNIGFGAGATTGPLMAGILFDVSGSYTAAFLTLAGASATSATIVLTAMQRRSSLPR